jgi:CheY-like chemotaxis protein
MSNDDRKNILIVDDESTNLAMLLNLLKDDYRVTAAKDGNAALDLIQNSQTNPDLILLDVTMPELDGFVVCRALKSNPPTAKIPIIFLTASDSWKDEQKGLQLGATDYITKPFEADQLIAKVNQHLAN